MFERGNIYYINNSPIVGSEQASGRPAIVVSNDKNNNHSSVIEVVYLTTQPKTYLPTHVKITSSSKPSTALCEQVYSVSVDRIGDWCGECTADEMEQIDAALIISLGLTPPQNSKEEITEKDIPAPQFDPILIAKMETERDLYKSLYEQLLNKVM